jgi:hypothetical protein
MNNKNFIEVLKKMDQIAQSNESLQKPCAISWLKAKLEQRFSMKFPDDLFNQAIEMNNEKEVELDNGSEGSEGVIIKVSRA